MCDSGHYKSDILAIASSTCHHDCLGTRCMFARLQQGSQWRGVWLRGHTGLSSSRDRPHCDCGCKCRESSVKGMSMARASSSNSSGRRRQTSLPAAAIGKNVLLGDRTIHFAAKARNHAIALRIWGSDGRPVAANRIVMDVGIFGHQHG